MPKLILHAGVHRTGTTSIQKYLAANRPALAAQGFVYPGDKENHQDIAWSLIRGSLRPEHFGSTVVVGDAPNVVVSAEDFCRLKGLSFLEKMTAGLSLHAIFFVRRQDDWLESWYNQNIKWPFHPTYSSMSPMEFLGTLPEYFWLKYDDVYRRWKPFCTGIDMVVFDEIEDSVDAFCARAGIDQNGLIRPESGDNSSLSALSLEIVRHLGMANLSQATRGKVLRAVRAFEAERPGVGTAVFPASVKKLIMERFDQSNRNLSLILGRGKRAPLFAPVAPVQVEAASLPDSQTLLRELVAPLLRTLDRQDRRNIGAS